jgi:hypothetical protein
MSKAEDVKEILDNRREFVFESPDTGEEQHYYIADPTGEDIRKSDWQYSKVYNQAMADDFPTQAQMIDVLKERGILGEDYEREVEQTRISLASALFRLENLTDDADDTEKEGLALEIATLRQKLFELNQRINGPLGNTCENIAEDARTEFLTSRVIQNKDGSRVWEEFDSFRDEEETALTVKSRFEVMLWLQGLESNFMENSLEQKTLREVAQHRLDAALNSMQENEDKSAEEVLGLPEETPNVEEVEEEAPVAREKKAPKPKKRGRPKKSVKKATVKKEEKADEEKPEAE